MNFDLSLSARTKIGKGYSLNDLSSFTDATIIIIMEQLSIILCCTFQMLLQLNLTKSKPFQQTDDVCCYAQTGQVYIGRVSEVVRWK